MDFVAFIAIILSTVSLGWQVYTWRKKQEKVELFAEISENSDPDKPPVSRMACICRIVNSGGQTVSLVEIWAEQTTRPGIHGNASNRYDIAGISLPLTLAPGQCHIWTFQFPRGHGLKCYARNGKGKVYACECPTV